MKKITTNDINIKGIEEIEDIINIFTQSRDIYKIQSRCNRALKILALYILKYLLEDILHEDSDFSLIKSNKTIQDYGQYIKCDTSILIEDSSKSLILNICNDMIYQTCVRGINKKETLYCLCNKDDNSDLLLLLSDYNNADLFEKTYNKKRVKNDII